jgi:hypothetical protein
VQLARSIKAYGGACVIAAVVVAALVHSSPHGPRPTLRAMPVGPARSFYLAAAEAEVETRKNAAGRFRGSPWSQDDQFHAKEAKFIRNYAKNHKVDIGTLVDALDRGMHEKWPTGAVPPPDQKVLPCRPRLNY